jgi:hypothetical protein
MHTLSRCQRALTQVRNPRSDELCVITIKRDSKVDSLALSLGQRWRFHGANKEVREEERFCVRFCSFRFERWGQSAECSCNGEMLFFRPSFWRRCMPCWIVSENCIPRRELDTWWAFSTVANARGENGFEIQWCVYSDDLPFLTERSVLELWIAVADVAFWRASAGAEPLKGESKLGICTCRVRVLLFTKLCFEVWKLEV